MKTESPKSPTPRRLYLRNGFTHLCFEGRHYGTKGKSALDLSKPVTCTPVKSDGGRGRVLVTQGEASETWRSVAVPRGVRKATKAPKAETPAPVAEAPAQAAE